MCELEKFQNDTGVNFQKSTSFFGAFINIQKAYRIALETN